MNLESDGILWLSTVDGGRCDDSGEMSLKKRNQTSTEGEPLVKYPVTGNDICNEYWWCQQKPTSAILVHWCSKQLEYFQGSWIHGQSAAQWCQHPTACSVWLQTQRLVIGDILGNNPQRDIQCLYGFRIAFMSSWMPDLWLIAAIDMVLHVHQRVNMVYKRFLVPRCSM